MVSVWRADGMSSLERANGMACCCSGRELELEDRHSRLEQQLRDRMSSDGECLLQFLQYSAVKLTCTFHLHISHTKS
jgi:hypothetical protein